ncbi:hypothetical protein AGMMS49965_08150 [Bacteroidia bacterium]|nr:hypothetical protein AGMMS49965_08150 [Bacteroidia bacterium]
MERKFIIDKEINLNENDFLKTKIYSDNLTKIIRNTESNKVFTVGLFGNWGTGKSSIIETSKQEFEQDKVKFVTYDAWQYVNDSFRRMFLRKLREDLQYEETDLMKKFYENEATDVGETYKFNWKNIPISIIVLSVLFIVCIVSIFCADDTSWKTSLTISAVVSFASLIYTILQGFILKLKISVTKPHLFAPEQFEECFKEVVSNSLSKTNKVLKWVKRDNSIQNLEKLVLVIDNIDRCSNDVAYNLLTDIKTFLSSELYSIVFVIPVDDEALKNHIIKNSKKDTDDCNKEKEEFLRKFFNVTIRIKPYGETDMYAFAKQICEKSGFSLKNETINIASKEFAKNPRRIIQLFNNLLAEMNYDYGKPDFANKNETLICCILIIREEYPAYYKAISNSPQLFNGEYSNGDANTNRFLRIAQIALGKVEISDLSRVLTNSYHQFDDIAADVKDAIETFDAEKVLNAWSNEQEHIADYIVDRLGNAIKNNLIETDMIAYVDLITQINIQYPLKTHFAKRVDEKVQLYLPNVISKTKNHENLCKYALLRERQGDSSVKTNLVDESKHIDETNGLKHQILLFNAVLKVFTDKETSIALSSTYTQHHNSAHLVDFSEEQIEYLISNEYVTQRIQELASSEKDEILLDTETKEYQKVKWLFENKKNIAPGTYSTLFARVIGQTNDESRMRGKTIDEIANILKFMNPLLNLIPDRTLAIQPQALYGLIVNDRKMPHPSYANQPNWWSQQGWCVQKNFVDDCIATDVYIQEITDFVINIYRITNNKTDVKNEIDKLLKHANLDAKFLKLITKGYTLNPILDLIFDDDENYEEKNNFKESNRLTLLQHCFNQKNKEDSYVLADEKVKTKLEVLLTYAQKENSNEVFTLLETLISQERYKNMLTALIVTKDSTFINSLPQKLLKLAVSSFKKDNSNDYADNFDFLSIIMQHGNNNQKGYVVTILTTKLDNNTDIEKVLNLIETVNDVSLFDSSGLLYSHLDKYQKDNKDNINQDIANKIKTMKKKIKIN